MAKAPEISPVARRGVGSTAIGVSADGPSSQPSQLFAGLTERLNPEQPLQVLDIGPGVGSTVEFFSEYPCQLHFANLYDALPLVVPDDVVTEEQKRQYLSRRIQSIMALPNHLRFDLCLFWDLFNYLDTTALGALFEALQPHLHQGSRGHGFVQRDSQKTPPNYGYGVLSANSFSTRPEARSDLPRHCHGQSAIERQLSGFTIHRGVLMLDGRLEFVLHYK